MKKRAVLILSFFLILNALTVSALVGVSPGIYEVDFEPKLREMYVFNFKFDEGVESELYVEGDLSDYVTLDRDHLVGGGQVISKMELPNKIDVPGPHKIFIGARQLSNVGGTIGIVGNVRGIILVNVPYPGQYVEIEDFSINHANQGNPINISLKVSNKGKEDTNVNAVVELYDEDEKKVDTIILGNIFIKTAEDHLYHKIVDTSDYQSGYYRARAMIAFASETVESETNFRLGTLQIKVSNYTQEFEKDKINQFNIEVESFWNNKIEDVYLDVNILDYDISFSTPSADVDRFSKKTFSGFFDTSQIEESKFKANVTINYAGKKTSEVVKLKFRREINYMLYALIGGGIFLVIFFISIIVAMIILFMRIAKNAKK